MRCRVWRGATGAPGIFTPPLNITDGMATGTISAAPAFTAGNIMAAASVPAGRKHPSGRCGIAGDRPNVATLPPLPPIIPGKLLCDDKGGTAKENTVSSARLFILSSALPQPIVQFESHPQ